MKKLTVGIIVGSTRKGSYSRAVGRFLEKNAPEDMVFRIVDIGGLPLYNQDLDEQPPAEWVNFRQEIKELDGVLFITPEHNRSIPAALKNALDIASRPYGSSVWNGKPGGIISVTPGTMGGFGANHHLRQMLTFLNVLTLQQPEAYIGNIEQSLDANGEVSADSLQNFLLAFQDAFTKWVRLIAKA